MRINILDIVKKRIINKYNNDTSFFFLTFNQKRKSGNKNSIYSDDFFEFYQRNLNPRIKKYEYKNKIIIIHGNPIIDEKIGIFNKQSLFDILEGKRYKKINGSFILFIFDKKKKELLIINDRFASFKLFYIYLKNTFCASSSFKILYELKKLHDKSAKIDQSSILEFIYFRQIFGDDTFEKNCKFFESASTFLLKKNNTLGKQTKYWEPKYYQVKQSREELIEDLAEKIKKSVRLYISDQKKHGLLLSGGLDSRCILGVSEKKLSCFTIAPKKNNEFYIAQSLANFTKNNHYFLLNSGNPLNSLRKFESSIFHLAGSYNYAGFDLISYKKTLNENADSVLMGLNFDFFYKALYLPKKNISFLGKTFLYKNLNNLNIDLIHQFIEQIGFKLKASDPFSVFTNKGIKEFKEKIYSKLNKIKDKGKSLNAEGYNLWEYIYYQNLSRNFNFSMVDSLSTFIDVRLPSLENSLFDLAINMPARYKLNGNVYNDVLNKICPDLMEYDYANTNIKAKYSLKKQNLIKIRNYFLKKYLNFKNYKHTPGWMDRSWNPPEYVLSNSEIILEKVKNLKNSKVLQSIDALDINKIRNTINEHIQNKKNNADLLNLLLTIDYCFE